MILVGVQRETMKPRLVSALPPILELCPHGGCEDRHGLPPSPRTTSDDHLEGGAQATDISAPAVLYNARCDTCAAKACSSENCKTAGTHAHISASRREMLFTAMGGLQGSTVCSKVLREQAQVGAKVCCSHLGAKLRQHNACARPARLATEMGTLLLFQRD